MRVVLAEDSAVLREGMVRLLELRGHQVQAAVGDGDELVAAVEELVPDVVVTDVRMPPGHTDEGLRAALECRRRRPGLPVLVFSQYVENRIARDLVAGSAAGVGYLLKDRVADSAEFLDALERVAAGGTALDPEVVAQLVRHGRDAVAELTPRELQVLAAMAEGLSNAAIATRLAIGERAVEKHVAGIFTTLDLPPGAAENRRVVAVLRYLRR
ncbi:response regulator [Kineococcus sp. T13]|uniref:response regulator transcription factor n=1 Tax=Kineococcus vitellinus TaxID=2696565 RepID=UPI001413726E|nr:response regulator transcription factor [Kineococcus vitellinus]NAZ77444.1 response regulator [Kineococcus vitellinus]